MSKQLVTIDNDRAITTSRLVAEHFDKKHKDVLEAIREILAAENSATKFFSESTFNNRGKSYPEYLMTRDGFSLLAMGFTGKKALKFKLDFINQFNKMEAKLKELAVAGHDQRWLDTRQLGKKTRKLLTKAIQALEEYFKVRGKNFPDGYLYGHLTNLIQNALSVEKGSRDSQSVKKLNQLDQSEDIAGDIILKNIALGNVSSFAEIEAQILLQLRQLNQLLCGQLFLPI